MGQLSPVLRNLEGGKVAFWCPGCKSSHALSVSGPSAIWGWDGNAEAPTFTPSVLFRSGHYIPGHEGPPCWCTYNADQRAKGKREAFASCGVCHSFVTGGQIQFLGDCTHELAGQTVALPPWPDQEAP